MLEHKSLITIALMLVSIMISGCSQSDGNSTSETSSWTPNTEVSDDNSTEESSLDVNVTDVSAEDNTTQAPEVMYGHTLPPEPDPVINNSTLLGVDVNKNGVRDDVERWIYKTYDTYTPCVEKKIDVTLPSGKVIQAYEEVCEDEPVAYHQIVREIAMQGARAAQLIIQEPEKARETTMLMDAAQDCNIYFKRYANDLNESILIDHLVMTKEFDEIQYNTIVRARAYAKYNFTLSGGVYPANETIKEMRDACDFNVDELLGK